VQIAKVRVSRREKIYRALSISVLKMRRRSDDHEVGGMIQITEVAASSRKPER
jgi:hypothetical protein